MSLSTHVLDTARGRPASGLPVRWETRDPAGAWTPTAAGVTDPDGRVAGEAWLPTQDGAAPVPAVRPVAGRHRLVFDVEAWAGSGSFFPEVTVTFTVSPEAAGDHHHVPLLLSPYAYSTYRGS